MKDKSKYMFPLLAASVAVLIAVAGAMFSTGERTAFTASLQTDIESPANQAVCGSGDSDQEAPVSCTIITASMDDTVLFANNEDAVSPETYYWVIPGEEGKYGSIIFGLEGMYPEGGVNEKGLAYDVNALPWMTMVPQSELPYRPDRLGEHLLAENATVEEAIAYLSGFSWGEGIAGQIHIADATGNAAVMSVGADGELTFTRKQPEDGYLVSTNFNLAEPSNGRYPCWRYDTATGMMGTIFNGSDLDVEQMRSVLDATHQEGRETNTLYSNIVDLRHGVIYLYYWYQFDDVIVIDVDELLSQGAAQYRMRDVFPEETVERAMQAHRHYTEMPERWRNVGRIYFVINAVSLVVLFGALMRNPGLSWRMRLIWVLATLLLGIFGLLAYMLSNRMQRSGFDVQVSGSGWDAAFAGTAHSIVGYGVVWVVTLAYLLLFVAEPGPGQILAFTYGVPLIVGLLLFRAPLIALRRKASYLEVLRRSFLPEFISLNMACIGFFPVVFLTSNTLFLSSPSFSDPLMWFLFAVGVLAGFISLLPLNILIAHRPGAKETPHVLRTGEPVGVAGDSLTIRNAWYLALFSFAIFLISIWLTISNMI